MRDSIDLDNISVHTLVAEESAVDKIKEEDSLEQTPVKDDPRMLSPLRKGLILAQVSYPFVFVSFYC